MKLLFCSSLLILSWFWLSVIETQANDSDVCQASNGVDNENIDDRNVSCFINPTKILKCSWSFHTLQEDTQLSVYMSISDGEIEIQPLRLLSKDRVGSESVVLHDYEALYVFLQFTQSNSSMHNMTVFSCEYEGAMIELLFPPPNISASVKDGALLVTWGVPHRHTVSKPTCFEYELEMCDQQEKPITLVAQQSYTNLDPDPTCTNRVRIRTKINKDCFGPPHWSDWSDPVQVEHSMSRSFSQYSIPAIISISLGIPMILLTVLLLVRHQRVSKVLFPPIPRPPSKYKSYLEKNDTFNVFHPVASAKPEEEITEVQDEEQNLERQF